MSNPREEVSPIGMSRTRLLFQSLVLPVFLRKKWSGFQNNEYGQENAIKAPGMP